MAGFGAKSHLNQIRMNVSYRYQNTYGETLGGQNTWVPSNPVLCTTGAPMSNGKPNSNGFIIEAGCVPFNGGNSNYDGFGRNAGSNNTLLLFAWMVF
jgi:hypothetical protein